MSGWLCGLVGIGDENEVVDTLTLQILKLPSVVGVLPLSHPSDAFAVATCFIKGVAAKFASIEVIRIKCRGLDIKRRNACIRCKYMYTLVLAISLRDS